MPSLLLSMAIIMRSLQNMFWKPSSLLGNAPCATDFDYINSGHGRLTLGAVNVRSGEMHYFDNRIQSLSVEHVMASGALPPAFLAVRIDGAPYWDGGI